MANVNKFIVGMTLRGVYDPDGEILKYNVTRDDLVAYGLLGETDNVLSDRFYDLACASLDADGFDTAHAKIDEIFYVNNEVQNG